MGREDPEPVQLVLLQWLYTNSMAPLPRLSQSFHTAFVQKEGPPKSLPNPEVKLGMPLPWCSNPYQQLHLPVKLLPELMSLLPKSCWRSRPAFPKHLNYPCWEQTDPLLPHPSMGSGFLCHGHNLLQREKICFHADIHLLSKRMERSLRVTLSFCKWRYC